MNLSEYQTLALRTEAPLPTPLDRMEHAALGLITEIGEIATEVKRMAIYGKPLDDERRAHIAEEVGDVLWYLAIASDSRGENIFADFMAGLSPREDQSLKNAVCNLACYAGTVASYIVWEREEAGKGANHPVGEALKGIAEELVDISGKVSISINQIAADNIAKLALRYPDKFSAEAAEARADKGGLDARNS